MSRNKVITRKAAHRITMYDDIPRKLLELEPPKDIIVKLSQFIDLSKNIPESSHQQYILEALLVILNTNDSDSSKLINLCFVVDNISMLQ
jgi:hypothetical protein